MARITYMPGNSLPYRLNPIIKGILVAFFVILLSMHIFSLLFTIGLLSLIIVSFYIFSVPMHDIVYSLKSICVLLLIVGVFQGFQNGTFVWQSALDASIRIIGVFLIAGYFITVSSQSELIYFWEICFRPLDLVGLSSKELALVMVIAVRFMPVILSELERIKISQMARGAAFTTKSGLLASARGLMPLLIPTISLSIMRANELALAMEARGYRMSAKRSRYKEFRISFEDIIVLIILIISIALIVYYLTLIYSY